MSRTPENEDFDRQVSQLHTILDRALAATTLRRREAKAIAADLALEMAFRGATVQREGLAGTTETVDCQLRRLRAVVLQALVDTRSVSHARAVSLADAVALELLYRGAMVEWAAMAG